jgi:hypothetical protein
MDNRIRYYGFQAMFVEAIRDGCTNEMAFARACVETNDTVYEAALQDPVRRAAIDQWVKDHTGIRKRGLFL